VTTESPDSKLWRLARAQWGVFSRAQALTVGLARGAIAARLANGSWVAVFRGVYRAASTPESWHQRLMAACLSAGDGAVASHRTAAKLHGLEGVSQWIAANRDGSGRVSEAYHRGAIELTVPAGRRVRVPGLLVHRSRALARDDRSAIEGIPVTSLARTLVDLSATLDERHLCMALDSGLARHRHIDVRMVRRVLRRLKTKGRPGTKAFGRLLDARAPDAVHLDSALERWFLAALRRARLPKPAEHYDVVEGGRHLAELDFAYPRERVGIELNGASVHRRYAVWERDQERLSDLAAAGWRILPVTWAQLRANEAAVMARVARALGHTSH
jgi:hypothetical protein